MVRDHDPGWVSDIACRRDGDGSCNAGWFVREDDEFSAVFSGKDSGSTLGLVSVEVSGSTVRMTKDGVLVAAHDDVVKASSGRAVSIARTTYAELRLIDLGDMWAGPARNYPLAGTHVSVPTIKSVLETFPGNQVGLELKVDGAEEAACSLLRSLKRTGDTFISSGGDGPVTRFKSICPEAVTTVTDAMETEYLHAEATDSPWCARVGIGQPPLVDRGVELTKENVQWDHDHGLADYTWTANTQSALRAVARLGVDAVYTDRAVVTRSATVELPVWSNSFTRSFRPMAVASALAVP